MCVQNTAGSVTATDLLKAQPSTTAAYSPSNQLALLQLRPFATPASIAEASAADSMLHSTFTQAAAITIQLLLLLLFMLPGCR